MQLLHVPDGCVDFVFFLLVLLTVVAVGTVAHASHDWEEEEFEDGELFVWEHDYIIMILVT